MEPQVTKQFTLKTEVCNEAEGYSTDRVAHLRQVTDALRALYL